MRIGELLQRIHERAPERIPRFFYLASCHGNSPTRVEAGRAGSLASAAELHREGITQVVGYFGPINDELSTRAEVALYSALAGGRTTRHAVREARLALAETVSVARAGHRDRVLERQRGEASFPFAWAQLVLYHRGVDHPLSLPLPRKHIQEQEARLERSFQGPEGRRILATGFIGRRRERHRVRRAVREGQRILVFQGLGGLGKSTLAFRVLPLLARGGATLALWCQELEQEENQARALVSYLSAFGQERLGQQWGQVALAVDQQPGASEPRRFALFLQAIVQSTGHLVLYLDNLESLLVGPYNEDPEAFGAWRTPELEAIWHVLEQAAGERLSAIASCRYRNPSFTRHIIHVPEMGGDAIFRMMGWFPGLRRLSTASRGRLVERLHGHPRAVEFLEDLVAASLSRWEERRGAWTTPATEAGIEREWRDLIAPALPQVEGRLRQDLLLDRIWERVLDEPARRMLFRMTLLRRPWDWDVMTLLGEPEEDASTAEATAERLRKTSLVGQVEEKGAAGQLVMLFQLHPTTARFIQERFGARGEELKGPTYLRVGSHLEALARSSPDIRVELDAGYYLFQAGELNRASELLGPTSIWLQERGRFRDALAILEPLLAEEATRRLDVPLQGRLLGTAGSAYYHLGQAAKGIEHNEQALAIFREIRDRRNEGTALDNLGSAYLVLGQVEKAIDHYQQALAIHKEIGNRRGEGAVLNNLGLAYADLGEVEKAIEHYQQALRISREIGNRRGEGAAVGNLGVAYAGLGKVEKAIQHFDQVLVIQKEIGNRQGEGAALSTLGSAYLVLGHVGRAIEHHQEGLAIAQEIGDRRGEGAALGNLGSAYLVLGQVEKAIEHYDQALAIHKEIGDRQGEGNDLGGLGSAYARLGQVEKATEHLESSLTIARTIKDPKMEATALRNLERLRQTK